jgi:hypothetical protein
LHYKLAQLQGCAIFIFEIDFQVPPYRPSTLACSASRIARISKIPGTVSGGGCLSNAASAALASSDVKSRIHR